MSLAAIAIKLQTRLKPQVSYHFEYFMFSGLATCQDGFVAHRNSCYLFSHETATWADAVLTCQLLDSQLVEIEDAVENAYLKAVVKGLGGTGWFIGLTDKAVEGEFVWMSSKKSLFRIFSDWLQGDPSNHNNDESCTILFKPGSYQWVDTSCENRWNYICEANASVSPPQVAPVIG